MEQNGKYWLDAQRNCIALVGIQTCTKLSVEIYHFTELLVYRAFGADLTSVIVSTVAVTLYIRCYELCLNFYTIVVHVR